MRNCNLLAVLNFLNVHYKLVYRLISCVFPFQKWKLGLPFSVSLASNVFPYLIVYFICLFYNIRFYYALFLYIFANIDKKNSIFLLSWNRFFDKRVIF